MTLTLGSLFAGIGGFDLGFERAGFKTLWACEIDERAQSVLRYRFPDAVLHDDVRKVGSHNLSPVDVLTFGSPCQDLSVAGKRAGLAGERSGLFHEAARIIADLRSKYGKPDFAIWENVPGAFSSNDGADFAAVVQTMVDIGAVDVAWRILDSRYFNVAQRRRRVFLVADFRAERSQQVLFEPESLRGHSETSGEAWEEIADDVGEGFEDSGRKWPAKVASTLNTAYGQKMGLDDQHALGGAPLFVPAQKWPADVAATLTSQYGNTRGLENQHALSGASWFVPIEQNGWPANITNTLDARYAQNLGLDNQHIFSGGKMFVPVQTDVANALTNKTYDPHSGGNHVVEVDSCYWNGSQVSDTLTTRLNEQRMPENGSFGAVIQGLPKTKVLQGSPSKVSLLESLLNELDGLEEEPADASMGAEETQKAAFAMEKAVAFTQNARDEVRLINGDGSIAGALGAESGTHQTTYVAQPITNAVAFQLAGDRSNPTVSTSEDVAFCLAANPMSDRGQAVAFQSSQSGVRLSEVHPTLDSNNGSRRHNGVLYAESPVTYPILEIGKRNGTKTACGIGVGKPGDPMFTLQASAQHGVAIQETSVFATQGPVAGTLDAGYGAGHGARHGVEREFIGVIEQKEPYSLHITQDPLIAQGVTPALTAGNQQGCSMVGVAYGFDPTGTKTNEMLECHPTLRGVSGGNAGHHVGVATQTFCVRTGNTQANGLNVLENQSYTLDTSTPHVVACGEDTPVPMVNMQGGKGQGIAQEGGPSYTLQAMHGHDVHAVLVEEPRPVCFAVMPQNSGKDFKAKVSEVAQPLMASGPAHGNQGGDLIVQPLLNESPQSLDTYNQTTHPSLSPTLRAGNGDLGDTLPAVFSPTMKVRRLTPTECERLQGFPDGWTEFGKWPDGTVTPQADGPRYKQLGNAVTVNVAEWIGKRVAKVLNEQESTNS